MIYNLEYRAVLGRCVESRDDYTHLQSSGIEIARSLQLASHRLCVSERSERWHMAGIQSQSAAEDSSGGSELLDAAFSNCPLLYVCITRYASEFLMHKHAPWTGKVFVLCPSEACDLHF